MKKAILAISIVLNIILIVPIAAGIRYTRRTSFQIMADVTAAEVQMQEKKIGSDLEM